MNMVTHAHSLSLHLETQPETVSRKEGARHSFCAETLKRSLMYIYKIQLYWSEKTLKIFFLDK